MTGSAPLGEDDLHAYADGRLDAGRHAAVEAWLSANPAAAADIEAWRRQKEALRSRLAAKAAEPIPARLRLAAIREQQKRQQEGMLRRIAAAVLWVAIGLGAGWGGRGLLLPAPGDAPVATLNPADPAALPVRRLVEDAADAHRAFVVEVTHPVEVKADQEQHLVKWLTKRVGKPLTAPDLRQFGYSLMGGRLLPAEGEAAAQLMYENEAGDRLTLYLRADDSGETAFRFQAGGDVSAFYWVDRGLGFALTATLDRERLLEMAEAVYMQFEKG
jgi:anti-sigma factor RsiW